MLFKFSFILSFQNLCDTRCQWEASHLIRAATHAESELMATLAQALG